MASTIQPFTVAGYSPDGGRLLYAVNSEDLQSKLINEAINLGGEKNGSWYAMATRDALFTLEKIAKDMGGYVYGLPFY